MSRDIDGKNDEYEIPEALPRPLIDVDDEDEENGADENAFDMMGDTVDLYETRDLDDPIPENADIMEGKYDIFSLKETAPDYNEDKPDIFSGRQSEEHFPIRQAESDTKKLRGEVGELIPEIQPIKSRSKIKSAVAPAVAIGILLVLFLAWTIGGITYTRKYNEHLYDEFRHGVDARYINPDFAYFITLNGKSIPVVKSETPIRARTVNDLCFLPGTPNAEDDLTVYCPSKLMYELSDTLIGEIITTENSDGKAEYEIISIGDYSERKADGNLIIYTNDKSSSTGYTAIVAAPVK